MASLSSLFTAPPPLPTKVSWDLFLNTESCIRVGFWRNSRQDHLLHRLRVLRLFQWATFVLQWPTLFDLRCLRFDIPHIHFKAIWGWSSSCLLRPLGERTQVTYYREGSFRLNMLFKKLLLMKTLLPHILLHSPFLLFICLPTTHLIEISKVWT